MFRNPIIEQKIIKHSCLFLFLLSWLAPCPGHAQRQILYKEIDTTKLFMYLYQPENMEASKTYPAMVFFFGGGWIGGSVSQFEPHAKYFSQRGMVCFLVDYRVQNRQHSTPFESLKDAKSAIRFIRSRSKHFQIDPDQMVASGGSAGGHLAAATALIENYNEETDDLTISCIPDALVLFNPVIDNGPGGYGYERIGEAYKQFSPLHNLKKGAPPTIFFLGTQDKLIPVETAQYYQTVMQKIGSHCSLLLYNRQGHGFFNNEHFKYYKRTVLETDRFLQSLKYLKEQPAIKIE